MAPDENNLDKVYAKSLAHWPYGFAVYQSTTGNSAFPGACGYLDEHSNWHFLFNIADQKTLEELGLTEPKQRLQTYKPRTDIRWEPRKSQRLTEKKVAFKGGVEEALTHGFVDASVVVNYKSEDKHGAILLTTPPVERRSYSSDSPIISWYNENVKVILSSNFQYHRDIDKYGLFIITDTHSTRKCSLIAWADPSQEIGVGMNAGTAGIAHASIHGKYAASTHEGGWNHYEAKANERQVVFMTFLRFRSHRVLGKVYTKTKGPEHLARAPDLVSHVAMDSYELPDGDSNVIEVQLERHGKLPEYAAEEDETDDP